MIPVWAKCGGLGTLIGTAAFDLTFSDAGAGAANLVPTKGTGSATFTRTTSAACWGPTGLLLTVAPGVARSNYTELTGAQYLGFWQEQARTNNCIQNRDFTNAAWVKTTMTPLKDQVGIDGAANSASSLLATGANATAAQTVTIAAVNRPFSIYVRQLVGVGGFDIAQDGATFTHFALTASYQRFTLVASQLNPVVTIRIPTNGDKIAVDYAMLEDNGGAAVTEPGTPIATTTVAVTRNADILTYPAAGNIDGTVGSMYVEMVSTRTGIANEVAIIGASGSTVALMYTNNAAGNPLAIYDGTTELSFGLNVSLPVTAPKKLAVKWSGAASNGFVSGVTGTPAGFDGDLGVGANLIVGRDNTAVRDLNGGIQNIRIWSTALTDAQLVALTT